MGCAPSSDKQADPVPIKQEGAEQPKEEPIAEPVKKEKYVPVRPEELAQIGLLRKEMGEVLHDSDREADLEEDPRFWD